MSAAPGVSFLDGVQIVEQLRCAVGSDDLPRPHWIRDPSLRIDGDADVQKALVAELLGTLLFQFFVGFSKGDALAAGISYGVLRMFPVPTFSTT